ncbi:MAG: M1 family aminopeptidase [Bacteroidota bacterium]
MWIFIRHEWKYWLKSPLFWIAILINTLLVFGAVSSDSINIGGGIGSVHKNAPYVIDTYYGVMSLVCLLMTTAFMTASANRDFQQDMYQFVFSSPIRERDYYFGKFIGAASISVIPLVGVSIGALLGPLMPWVQPERYSSASWSGHIMGMLTFGIPNTIIIGCLIFVLAILYRSNIVGFAGAIFILVFYIVSAGFVADIEKEWLANILDPFGFRPLGITAKYMTIEEKNLQAVPLVGALLINRLIWMSISLITLLLCFLRFSFNTRKEKLKKVKPLAHYATEVFNSLKPRQAEKAGSLNFTTLWYLIRFETRAIMRNPTFLIIVVLGLLNLLGSLTSFTGRYGTDQYPVTYDVVDSIRRAFYLFLIAIITFYSGVTVWKERDARFDEIQDASPVRGGMMFTSKLVAMLFTTLVVISLSILEGIIAQTLSGYHRYQLDVYVKSLLISDFLSFSYLIVVALLIHYLLNNRYVAYFIFIAFVILNQFVWRMLEVNSNMLKFGGTPAVTYSDMNGFGPFVTSLIWFNIYWSLAAIIIALIAYSFMVRGKEYGMHHRLKTSGRLLLRNKVVVGVLLIVFVLCGGFVFYNTKVLNTYDSPKESENKQVDYEKTYKKYEHLAQPRFYQLDYQIDIQPYERSLTAKVSAWVRNCSHKPINELQFTMPQLTDSIRITIPGSTLRLRDNRLNFRIYALNKPMLPQDSILIQFDVWSISRGFENELSFTQLTQNGTFFNNTDILPSFGYSPGNEISDKNKRIKLKLPPRIRMPKLDEKNIGARSVNYVTPDADWVNVNTVISTTADQIALAPGSLLKSWESGGRKYFNYKLDHKSWNFYSFISARYEVARKKWQGVDLEVYYVKEHAYNVPNMMRSLEKSLEYYTANFGPYYHKQCRILEFPRYSSFAQSFPGTMPYSEGIGFILDERKVSKDDIDEVFYVVAHEMAHQYWAHQVCGAYMQGSEMMSESFAQYSALMVMEREYGHDKMKKFLKYEMDGYLRGRSNETEAERPLMKTENQGYIHYQKGSVVMYYLKEMIGEKKVNEALRSLIDTFAYRNPPYPTSWVAVRAFQKVTPDSLQYLIQDLFENITVFSNRVIEIGCKKEGEAYVTTFKTSSLKFRADSLGKETRMPLADYVDVGLFALSTNKKNLGKPLVYKRIKLMKEENVFTFRTLEKPYQAGIDPYNYLIDRQPEDNLRKIDL